MKKDKDTKAEVEETALVVADKNEVAALPSLMDQFAENAGAGSENITNDAMAIPFLRLLQAKNPEVENDPDNFKPGMLLHSITGRTYDIREKGGKPLHFMQVFFAKQIVEWGDKDAGKGGLKARHVCDAKSLAALEKLPRNDKNKILAPGDSGNTLEETAYHYLILLPEDGPEVGVLPLKSTGLTPSKRLMRTIDTQIMRTPDGRTFKPPTFAKVYSVQSFLDKQKSGAQNTFVNLRFNLVGDVTEQAHFDAAVAFYKSITAGTAKLDDSAEGGASADTHDGHEGAGGTDDDTPF